MATKRCKHEYVFVYRDDFDSADTLVFCCSKCGDQKGFEVNPMIHVKMVTE